MIKEGVYLVTGIRMHKQWKQPYSFCLKFYNEAPPLQAREELKRIFKNKEFIILEFTLHKLSDDEWSIISKGIKIKSIFRSTTKNSIGNNI